MGEEQHGHPSTSAWVLVKSKGYGQAAFGATSFARRACRVMGRDRCVAGGHVRISGEDHYSGLKRPRWRQRCRSLAEWGWKRCRVGLTLVG